LRWLRQQLSSPKQVDDNVKSFSVHLVEGTQSHASTQRQWLWDTLSAREMEVARFAANGHRNSEIARDLHISVRTAETHMKHLYTKLDVRSRIELARIIRDLVD
jgi:DNA-binding NarL/FixJ family response regulator